MLYTRVRRDLKRIEIELFKARIQCNDSFVRSTVLLGFSEEIIVNNLADFQSSISEVRQRVIVTRSTIYPCEFSILMR